MKKGGNKAAAAAPKQVVATIGLVTCGPVISTGYSNKSRKLANGSKAQEQSYERVSKMKKEDPKTGTYERYTTKEKVSTGQVYKEKGAGSGQVGVKNEFKVSSTVKVGNKRGYTEYYTEERVRDVSFDSKSSSSSNNNNRLTYGYYSQGNDCDYY